MNIKISAVFSSLLLSGVVADESCKSVSEIVCSDYKNFCGLLTATGTTDDFDQDKVTVFVPTDGAVSSMDFLVSLEDEKLTEVVLYHLYEKELPTDKMECYAGYNTIGMASGKDSRTVCVDELPAYQKGGANPKERRPAFVSTNIEACNGIIHVLDTVMLPNGYQDYEVAASSGSSKSGSNSASSTGTRLLQSGWFAIAAGIMSMYL
uniref:FAS1 domain-containing protein n=1 Tax=Pseudo-nitzschia delicatissima TaxID=44447 RepID=A0A7S0TAN2_9STRA|mmetsp:Transcript_659/g.1510  ORF Transcript_659/g.1510 Transcript_659/m.1510 type:complete len:207 (+) Transcript_659:60-680(+)